MIEVLCVAVILGESLGELRIRSDESVNKKILTREFIIQCNPNNDFKEHHQRVKMTMSSREKSIASRDVARPGSLKALSAYESILRRCRLADVRELRVVRVLPLVDSVLRLRVRAAESACAGRCRL